MMGNSKQAARYSNTKAANIKKLQSHFTETVRQVKAEFIRLSVWLVIVRGA